MEETKHLCDERCVCPIHGTDLIYSRGEEVMRNPFRRKQPQPIERPRRVTEQSVLRAAKKAREARPHTPMSDDQCLSMLSGASFGPNASLTLPSGKTISGDEAQVMTSLFGPDICPHCGHRE